MLVAPHIVHYFTCVRACQWIKELWPAHLISIAVKLCIKLVIPGKKGTFWFMQFLLYLLDIMGGYQYFTKTTLSLEGVAELGLQWTEQKLWWGECWGCFCSQSHTGTATRLLSNCNKKHNYFLKAGNGSLDPKHKQERTKHTVFMWRLIIPGFSTSYKGRTCTVWKWGETEQNPTYLIGIDLVEGGKCL